jgi:cysteine desulfurase / selenocysteine lyase
MLGPEGAGLFYVARRNLDRLRPQMVGWNSVIGGHEFSITNLQFKPTAERFEGGTMNMVGMIGLGASLKLLLEHGCHEASSGFADSILANAEYAQRELNQIGSIVHRDYAPQNRSGIVCFEVPGVESAQIRSRCLSEKIILSVRHGKLRIAVHAYNNAEDIDRLVAAIKSF